MATDERAKQVAVLFDLQQHFYSLLASVCWILRLKALKLVNFLREQIGVSVGHLRALAR
jgi:hypothetical protein